MTATSRGPSSDGRGPGDARLLRATQLALRAGNTLAIEPVLHAGSGRHRTKKDSWSIVMTDGKRAAPLAHTVAVTGDGPEILTALPLAQTSQGD